MSKKMQSRKCRNKTEQDKIMEPSRVSLIDLKHQFPFEIDAEIKDRICFAETLVISCGHYEGEVIIDADSLQTEWTCEETESHEETEESKEESVEEVKDYVEQETPEEPLSDSEDNFHFYFYHDCSKPKPPINSDTSIITIKGIPEENPAKKLKKICTCPKDRKGECTCFTKIPCYCGAKVKKDCTCAQLETVCICDETKPPAPVCTCDKAQICICHPDGKVRPVCDCEKVEKPCVCCQSVGISPSPVCTCKHKPEIPKKPVAVEEVIEESDWVYEGEIEDEFETFSDTDTDMTKKRLVKRLPKLTKKEEQICTCKVCGVEEELEPCTCQQPEKKPYCECLKDKKCTCGETICVCGIRKTCVCEPGSDENVIFCVDQDDRSICSCPNEPVCTCDKFPPYECECFKIKETECTCGDRENCICFHPCECPLPCTCDTTIKKDICTCLERQIPDATICTCPEEPEENRKLIKLRAGKVGYRWCREVDPKHTYFDYAYGRHDKISYKEQMKEKFKILGLHDGKDDKDDECPVHGVKAPAYVKKVRRPSLDCCSAVGGISISIETLGADKDKFLVQVVSNSSKEGAVTGSKLVAIVDCKLHTMEENRIEYISNTKSTKTRKSYIAICENGYFNKITRICGDKKVVKRLYHSFEESRKLLLEGANMVLLRYFALSRYKGNIKTSAVLIDGMVCQSIYVCHGVSQGVVNGKPMFVVKIERHLIQPSGIIYQTLSVMTLKGYFISHEWADSNYVMHINPLLHVDPVLDEIESHAHLRERWREDLQLFSDYLDFKSVRTSEGGRYVRENGDLTNTIRDYLQALLLLKPQDAIHFTRHYFGSCLSALDLPHNEFFDAQTKHVRYYFFEE